jgi:hypothetical protein
MMMMFSFARMMLSARLALALALTMAICACGGGGGGGGGPPPIPTGLTVRFDTSALTYEYPVNDPRPGPKFISAYVSGATDKDVVIGAEVTGSGIELPIQVTVNMVSRSAGITVTPARGLAAGVYSGTIKLMACTTQNCSQQHAGSPHMVSYTVTVLGPLKAPTAEVSLAATETGVSAASRIDLTLPAPNSIIDVNIRYLSEGADWLNAQVAGSVLTVQASAKSLPAATYRARVELSVNGYNFQPVSFFVSLIVSNGLSVPAGASFEVGGNTTVSQMSASIPLDLAPGTTATTWSADSDQPWLKLERGSAAVNVAPVWRIDLPEFAKLANSRHYKALIRIRTDSALATKTFTLDVHKTLPEILGLDSLALLAGQGGDVMLYGRGFAPLNASLNAVTVAGAVPSAVTILSDQVLRLTLPGLQVGSYMVNIGTRSGMAYSGKAINVTGRDTFGYQAVDTEGVKSAMVWDAVSKSVFVANKTMNSVMRFRSVNGRFELASTRSFPQVEGLAMTPDHAALIVQSDRALAYRLSPADLSTLATIDLKNSAYTDTYDPLTLLGDNSLLTHEGWLALDTGAFKYGFDDDLANLRGTEFGESGGVSGNGLRMLRSGTSYAPILRFDLISGKYSLLSGYTRSFFYHLAVDHAGNNWAYNGQVVDFESNIKGLIEMPTSWYSAKTVFSRDGARLYVYAKSEIHGEKSRVYVFDTSTQMITRKNFPILGFIALNDEPNCVPTARNNWIDECARITQTIISDDDQTLFLAGDAKFVVLPIPMTMRAVAAARPGTPVLSGQTLIPATGR